MTGSRLHRLAQALGLRGFGPSTGSDSEQPGDKAAQPTEQLTAEDLASLRIEDPGEDDNAHLRDDGEKEQ